MITGQIAWFQRSSESAYVGGVTAAINAWTRFLRSRLCAMTSICANEFTSCVGGSAMVGGAGVCASRRVVLVSKTQAAAMMTQAGPHRKADQPRQPPAVRGQCLINH